MEARHAVSWLAVKELGYSGTDVARLPLKYPPFNVDRSTCGAGNLFHPLTVMKLQFVP